MKSKWFAHIHNYWKFHFGYELTISHVWCLSTRWVVFRFAVQFYVRYKSHRVKKNCIKYNIIIYCVYNIIIHNYCKFYVKILYTIWTRLANIWIFLRKIELHIRVYYINWYSIMRSHFHVFVGIFSFYIFGDTKFYITHNIILYREHHR